VSLVGLVCRDVAWVVAEVVAILRYERELHARRGR
jgi:hypothetical protein